MTAAIVIAAASDERATGRCVASVRRFVGDEKLELMILPCEQSAIFRARAEGIERATAEDRKSVV